MSIKTMLQERLQAADVGPVRAETIERVRLLTGDDGDRDVTEFVGDIEGQGNMVENVPPSSGQRSSHVIEQPADVRIESMTSAKFFEQEYHDDYIVEGVLNRGENCIIGGAMKTLKTSLMVDLAISVGHGCPFLGRFKTTKAIVGVISGESGQKTLQGVGKRVAKSKGRLASQASVHWSFKLPCLMERRWQRALVEWINGNEIELLFIDPTYLALLDMNTAKGASNLFVMGAALRELADTLQETSVTPALLNHIGKGAARTSLAAGDPPDLMDLSMSGFGEFARQWILTGRRERYVSGSGVHKLWLNVGGSAGHNGLYAVDIDEGTKDDPFGRRWDVKVMQASEASAAENAEQADKRALKAAEKRAADQEHARNRIVAYLERLKTGDTRSSMRDKLGGGKAFTSAVNAMYDNGELVDVEVTKNGRSESGINLKSLSVGTVGTVGIPTDDSGRSVVVGMLPPCKGEHPSDRHGGEDDQQEASETIPSAED